jgi:hypothetical protein
MRLETGFRVSLSDTRPNGGYGEVNCVLILYHRANDTIEYSEITATTTEIAATFASIIFMTLIVLLVSDRIITINL